MSNSTNPRDINYITDFICTYQRIKDLEDSTLLYRLQFLQAFNLKNFDEEKINTITEQLYEKYKDNPYIDKLIETDAQHVNDFSSDKLTCFRIYFGYEIFYLFHNLLCSLINNTSIDTNNYNKLLNNELINI